MALQEERKELRKRFLQIRQRIGVENKLAQKELCACLLEWLEENRVTSVGFYWPYRFEPDLRNMISEWLSRDSSRVAAIPVVDDQANGQMHYSQWKSKSLMRLGAFGIAVPAEDVPVIPKVILSPCVAFNDEGYRLGNGGGFFDRYLAGDKAKSCITVAVGYDALRALEFSVASHDVAFDYIATETGIRKSKKNG